MQKRFLILIAVLSVFAVAIWGWAWYTHSSNELIKIARPITQFKPYYFQSSSIEEFSLKKRSVSYANDVLVFTMQNQSSKKVLAATERRTPDNFDIASLRADKEFKTQYGQAFITDGATRTTGALFTDDKTWILINAPDPIGADAMQKILNAFRPI